MIKFLQELVWEGWVLWVHEGSLKYRAPKGDTLPEVLAKLKCCKDEVIRLLSEKPEVLNSFPLSYGQRALWYLYKLDPQSASYNVPYAFRLTSRVDVEALREAFQVLSDRHPALRTTFSQRDDIPVQTINATQTVDFQVIDTVDVVEREFDVLFKAQCERPIDIENGPVMSVRLFVRGADEHVLLLLQHHIVTDGVSLGILAEEILVTYKMLQTGQPLPERQEAPSYIDYVRWQHKFLSSDSAKAAWGHWEETLAGELPVLDLPIDKVRPLIQMSRGASLPFTLDSALTMQLKALAQQCAVTEYVVLLGAFQILLHRYSGQQDVLVGTPASGRSNAEFESIVGYFANLVAIRADFSSPQSLKEFLQAVQKTVREGVRHQDLPFAAIVEHLKPTQDPSRSPVVQATFALQKFWRYRNDQPTPGAGTEHPGELRLEPMKVARQEGISDLDLEIEEGNESLHGLFKYNASLFEEESIEQLCGSFKTLLSSMVGSSNSAVDELALLSAEQSAQALTENNRTTVACDACVPIHELFERQVQEQGDAIAVICEGVEITYQELNDRADRLACHLVECGVAPDVLVAIYMERSIDMVIGMLAILKAGGAYLPIDSAYPIERVVYVLEDSCAPIILTQTALLDGLSGTQGLIVDLQCLQYQELTDSLSQPAHRAAAHHLAYVIYTSGSTGKPKGVMIEHRQVHRLFEATRRWFNFSATDVWTAFHSFAFDFSVWEIWGALLHGAKLVIVPSQTARDPDEFYSLTVRHGVTVLNQTPSAFRHFVEAEARAEPSVRTGLALKHVIFGGEALDFKSLAPWIARHGESQPKLVNMYGITETTVHVTYHEVKSEDLARGGKSLIGTRIDDLALYVLDRHMNPVPKGVVGELYIGGAGVARGYLNRPELTNDRFVNGLIGGNKVERLYRSGDLVRRLNDGVLEYVGRIDSQVKIRGYRIELGEVEAQLLELPSITRSCVLLKESGEGDKGLAAFVVCDDEQTSFQDVIHQLKSRLPTYMLPSSITFVKDFPLTTNGKIDRASLLAMEQSPTWGREYVVPETDVEKKVASIFADMLNISDVSLEDNFFELGGHSLLATRLVTEIDRQFSVELPLRALFEVADVKGLSALIEHSMTQAGACSDSGNPYPVLTPALEFRHEPFPLNEIQQSFWLGRNAGLSLGNVSSQIYLEIETLQSALDLSRLEVAWRAVICRHDILRTVIDGNGQQIALQSVEDFTVQQVDLSNVRDMDLPERLSQLRDSESHRVTSSSSWPLFDCQALILPHGKLRILIRVDMLLLDGTSLLKLMQELGRYYQTPEVQASPLSVTFRDYVLAMKEYEGSDHYQHSLEYWRKRLESLPEAPQLPVRAQGDSEARVRFARRRAVLSQPRWSTLKAQAQSYRVTPTSLIAGAFALVLGRWSRSHELTLNLTTFNRMPLHEDIGAVLGNFTSLLLLGIDANPAQTFKELLSGVQGQLISDLTHRGVNGVQVLRELNQGRAGNPVVMPVVLTSLLGIEVQGTSTSWLGEVVYSITQTPQVWLDHQVFEEDGALVYNWDYVEGLFEPAFMEAMFAAYQRLLEDLAAAPALWEQKNLPLLTDIDDRYAIYNATAETFATGLLHEPFVAMARETPQQMAVLTSDRSLTYGELLARSSQLARVLVDRGVKPNDLVGVAMGKGWEQVVAVLAVSQAGGAYVPLDPELPSARLELLLQQTGIEVLLTQSWLVQSLPVAELTVLSVDASPGADRSEAPLPACQSPTDLAYVIFTSGSTGSPKGVMIDHRGALNTINDINRKFAVGPQDRVFGISSLSFDLSVYDVFGTLAAGATLVLPEEGERRDPNAWLRGVTAHGVTIWNSVPAIVGLLLEAADRPLEPGNGLESLRLCMMSGDWIGLTLPERLRAHNPDMAVIGLGGATEVSIWSVYFPIGKVAADWASIPYGYPLANQSLRVLSSTLEPCPVGVPGDIYIGGVGLSLGYFNDAQRSAKQFIRHPQTSERLYKTGDLGVFHEAGYINFLGREDNQVKVQGYRVELGEIEAVLNSHEKVKGCAVLAKEDVHGAKYLVAYVVAETEDASEFKRWITQRLPRYMTPSVIVSLAALPLTQNAKVDKNALLAMDDGIESATAYIAPRNEIEEALVEMYRSILAVDCPVGVGDNFFELGGHSLLATQLVAEIRERFSITLALRAIFAAETLEDLALAIQQSKSNAGVEGDEPAQDALSSMLVARPEDRFKPFPLNEIQHAYWLGRTEVFAQEKMACQAYVELDVSSADLDIRRLEKAWGKLIHRHDMLRTIFTEDGQQCVLEEVPEFHITQVDLTALDDESLTHRLSKIRADESHKVTPADQWPLFDCQLLLLPDARQHVLIRFDMLIADAASFAIIIKELRDYYEKPDTEIAPVGVTFRDYVLAVNEYERSDQYQRSLEYWRERLESLPEAPQLPVRTQGDSEARVRFARRRAVLSQPRWSALKAQAQSYRVTPTSLIAGAFALVLGRWSRSHELTLNLTTFNRMPLHEDIGAVLGDFTSLLLLGIDANPAQTFKELLSGVQGQLISDLTHRGVNGVQVLRELNQGRAGNPVVMPVVLTSLLGIEVQGTSTSWLGEVVYSITQTPQVWLDHQVFEEDGALVYNWDYVEGLFEPAFMEAMFAAYQRLLEDLAAAPALWEQKNLPLLTDIDDRYAIYNATAETFATGLLHEPFVAMARETPQQIAVLTSDRSLTYGELLARSSQLARVLVDRGVKPNDLVGVAMGKGWEQVVAVLAVSQAGGAYVPLDPELPSARLELLLQQTGIEVLLTQSWLVQSLPVAGLTVLSVDASPGADRSEAPLPACQSPTDLAYVIFTSGSTGSPKGVMIDHRGALNTINDINRKFAVGPQDRVFGISSLSFDLSVYDVFGTLAAGATLVLPEEGERRDPNAWLRGVTAHGVTIWNSVPAIVGLLLEAADRPLEPGNGLESLRLCMMSGDWIGLTLPERLRAHNPDMAVIGLGGATEVSIWSVYFPIGKVAADWASIPYGYPLANQSLRVLSSTLEPCPVGVPGDIYIGGVGLSLGYFNDAQRSAKQFIRHPQTSERLYKTGDLGVFHEAGYINFLGREDNQVKVQGYRVELGEIEAVLNSHEEVKECVVLTTENTQKLKSLVAYVATGRQPLSTEFVEGEDDQGLITDPVERLIFKRAEHGLGTVDGCYQTYQLPKQEADHLQLFGRSVLRNAQAVAGLPVMPLTHMRIEQFSSLLSGLARNRLENKEPAKYYYPSAGSLYPVQVYMYIPASFLDGIPAGYYRYERSSHQLHCFSEEVNSATSSLEFYLIGNLAAIEPMYGAAGRGFCHLEAGHMLELLGRLALAQGLMLSVCEAPENGDLSDLLRLDDRHVLCKKVQVQTADAMPDCTTLTLALCARQSYRRFERQLIAKETLVDWLGASFADLPALAAADCRVGIYIKEQRVTGTARGFYLFNTQTRTLDVLSSDKLDMQAFNVSSRSTARSAAFAVFVIAAHAVDTHALATSNLQTLSGFTQQSLFAAGWCGQALMSQGVAANLGVCPIGLIERQPLISPLRLGGQESVMYTFLGGGVNEVQKCLWQSEDESETLSTIMDLKDQMKARLPQYMVPAAILTMDTLPLSINGKVDVNALRSLDITLDGDAQFLAPRSETEAVLAEMVCQIVGVDRVSVRDVFFEIGGNSLSATQLVSKIRERFGIEIPLRTVFESPTIEFIAGLIDLYAGSVVDEEMEFEEFTV
ncbi:amino acid adenylation domain-containing protein [Pseudomonas frederiksbergensis]|uniref:amino acid adenylation domain-containing protein n=1 Tax=Pseudomonas frederiksbergensis TaxID=104087 RepID=UPI003D23267A